MTTKENVRATPWYGDTAGSLKSFKLGQRVFVNAVMARPHGEEVPLRVGGQTGTVRRLLQRDDSAWIELDERSELGGTVHMFPEDDEHGRGRHVLAFPDQCDRLRREVSK